MSMFLNLYKGRYLQTSFLACCMQIIETAFEGYYQSLSIWDHHYAQTIWAQIRINNHMFSPDKIIYIVCVCIGDLYWKIKRDWTAKIILGKIFTRSSKLRWNHFKLYIHFKSI